MQWQEQSSIARDLPSLQPHQRAPLLSVGLHALGRRNRHPDCRRGGKGNIHGFGTNGSAFRKLGNGIAPGCLGRFIMEPSLSDEASPLLGVALSGGGVRASLFALGALIYLVDSGACTRVAEISSVSGGSITNAFVAQRCDFKNVTPEEFDKYASQLAKAITSGLVTRRFVIATYGLLGIAVLLFTFFSPRLGVPAWLDLVLITLFGVFVLLRGALLAHLFQRQLFGLSGLPNTLGSIASHSTVAHVFCATDLNASMPVYFTSVGKHFYSPAWGHATSEKAAQITLADAVRASAAAPGGIPPKRLNVHDFGLSLTPLRQLQRWQELVFSGIRRQPSALYLVDGGVWNNLGTDWFQPSTELLLLSGVDWHPKARQQLVVDATAPTAIKLRLWFFWLPYIAEVLSLFRVSLVLYTSTVIARIEEAVAPPTNLDVEPTGKKKPFVVRMIDPVSQARKLGHLVWIGEPDHWSGRWSLPLALKRLLKAQTPTRRLVVRGFARLHEYTSSVPTTLFPVPPEVAVQLLIHGYVSTAHAITQSRGGALENFPGVERFTKLLGLEAHQIPGNATFLGSISALQKVLEVTKRLVKDIGEEAERQSSIIDEHVLPAIDKQREQIKQLLEQDHRLDQLLKEGNYPLKTAKPVVLVVMHQYGEAVEHFGKIFARIDMHDKSVDVRAVVFYAYALARTGDNRARDVTGIAAERLTTISSESVARKPDAIALDWWHIAKAYAVLEDAESAVRCLRESFAQGPKDLDLRRWLISERTSKEDAFVGIGTTLRSRHLKRR
jgi:predicted acylesterase/phospholipase RssA